MSNRTKIARSAAIATFLALAAAQAAHADVVTTAGSVTIAGSTAFAGFFQSPGSTNDFIDVNGDGIFGFNPAGGSGGGDAPFVQQLAPAITTTGGSPNQVLTGYTTSPNLNGASLVGQWSVQYIGTGSVLGVTALVQSALTNGGTLPSIFFNPSSLNATAYTGQPGQGQAGFPLNTPLTRVDAAVVDVAMPWAVVGTVGTPKWNAKPTTGGYGQNTLLPASATNGTTNALASLSFNGDSLNLNTATPNSKTIFSTGIAFAPISFVTNHGTGLQNVTQGELAFMYVTGRASDGSNYIVGSRDSGSGTRNGAMNSLGVDPSFGVGDNVGGLNTAAVAAKISSVGPDFQPDNLDATGTMGNVVRNARLGIGYVSTSTGKTNQSTGAYETLGIQFAGGTGFVRPTADTLVNNGTDGAMGTGYRIGGVETVGTVGDPLTATTSAFTTAVAGHGANPAMANRQAALYIRNIFESVQTFSNNPTTSSLTFMPAQSLITVGVPLGASKLVQDSVDPSIWSPNTAFSAASHDAELLTGGGFAPGATLNTGAYGSGVAAFGVVPTRQVLTGNATYSDGQAGTYRFYDSTATTTNTTTGMHLINAGVALNARQSMAGDFNNDGVRNVGDAAELMKAVANPTNWAIAHNSGLATAGNPATAADLGTTAIPEVIGDFNSDGNFDGKDVRYFADGLAIATSGPNAGHLDRKAGFAAVDTNWTAATAGHPVGNYFNTSFSALNTKTYVAGDSRGDISGATAATSGAGPTGSDGIIDAKDINYTFAQIRKATGQTSLVATNGSNPALDVNGAYATILTRASTNAAVDPRADLSADMNGDLRINADDANELVLNIVGTLFGDANLDRRVTFADFLILQNNYNLAGGWAEGDWNGDGTVSFADFLILQNNYNQSGAGVSLRPAGTGTAGVPEPGSLMALGLGSLALMLRKKRAH